MTVLPRISIIIVNYNMAQFIASAIESALAQDHADVDVIVVDDASTDHSREIIAGYEGRVRTVFLEKNVGQTRAQSVAWPLACHPIVIFLDSDDTLLPHAASRVAAEFTSTTAKVQFCLQTIDAAGRTLDHVAPKYPNQLDTDTIRHELLRTGSFPSAQGSGNAYAKWMLEGIKHDGGFVMPHDKRLPMDAVLEVNAPFYGQVVTLREPLACYRMHDLAVSGHHALSPARFERMVEKFDRKLAYVADRCLTWGIPFNATAARERCLWALEYRLAWAKLAESPQTEKERPRELLWPALRACVASSYSYRQRMFRGVWIAAVALLPTVIAIPLIEARFVVLQRPHWLERIFHSNRRRRGTENSVLGCES